MEYLPFMRQPTILEKVWMTAKYPVDLVSRPFQALLSIPALSFFVIPAFTSYSTTVNFFFFYLTWAVLIRSNDPLKVELLGSLGIRLVFYLLPSLGFLLFDSATPSLAINIKQHGDRALPMGEAQGGWKGRWWRIALISFVNVLLGITLQMATELLFTQVLHIGSALLITTTPPFPWTIAKDVFFCLLLREISTYVLHRFILHSEGLRLSKWHNSWQHSVSAPFSLVAHYDHPIAYLVHVFVPTFVPAIVLRLHLLSYHLYLIIVSLEEAFAYSGYNVLPSAFILGGIARRQERHIMGGGDGNYGCFGLIDLVAGTSVGGDLIEDVVEEADEKQISQRTKKKVKTVAKKAEKATVSESGDQDTGEQEGEEGEEAPRPRRRRTRKSETSDSMETSGHAEDGTPTRRKAGAESRKTRRSNDEKEDESAEVKKEEGRPKRKASARTKNGKKTSAEVQDG